MTNIHDNEILSYKVDLKNRKIVFNTQYRNSKLAKNVDIIFTNVLAHFFENELMGSIIFDIERYGIDKFIEGNKAFLLEHKNYGWPIDYDTLEELQEKLICEQYSYYLISSSYGLSGWVVSKNYETKTI